MWPTIDRARRRISGGPAAPADRPDTPEPTPVTETADPADQAATIAADATDDVVILPGPELEPLLVALQRFLGRDVERPDTPQRIERALVLLIASRGGTGRPRVLRRPAGLSTPEAWEIHLDGVDRATGDAVRDASRTGRF
jgi:hypothetical protein